MISVKCSKCCDDCGSIGLKGWWAEKEEAMYSGSLSLEGVEAGFNLSVYDYEICVYALRLMTLSSVAHITDFE